MCVENYIIAHYVCLLCGVGSGGGNEPVYRRGAWPRISADMITGQLITYVNRLFTFTFIIR